MKTLLKKIIPKKSSTPLDRLAWLKTLEDKDEVVVLQQSVQFLSAFYDDNSLGHAERLRILTKLDQLNRKRIETLSLQYAETYSKKPEINKVFSDTIYYYQRHLFRNYQQIVGLYFQIEHELPENMRAPHLLICRALYALFESHKLRYMNLQSAPDGSWKLIFDLFKLAESKGLNKLLFKLYDSSPALTINDVFAQGCMLDTLFQANLNKRQLRIASFLLERFLTQVEISKENDDEAFLYFVDFAQDKGARRIRNMEDGDYRFWKTDGLSLRIHKVLVALHLRKPLAGTILESVENHPELLSTVIFLDSEWSRINHKRQRRKEDRKKVSKPAISIYGFGEICEYVKYLTTIIISNTNKGYVKSEKSLDERLRAHSVNLNQTPKNYFTEPVGEPITVTDESTKGLGFKISKQMGAWSTQGNLVAVTYEGNREEITLGLIKSSKQINTRDVYLGVEKLSTKAFWVEMFPYKELDHSGIEAHWGEIDVLTEQPINYAGLYYVSEFDRKNASYMFMPRAAYIKDAKYLINLFGKQRLIKLNHAIENKEDWALVSIDIDMH